MKNGKTVKKRWKTKGEHTKKTKNKAKKEAKKKEMAMAKAEAEAEAKKEAETETERIRVRFWRRPRNGCHFSGRQQARKLHNPDTRRKYKASTSCDWR